MPEDASVLRPPTDRDLRESAMARYVTFLAKEGYGDFAGYPALYRWSIERLEDFWESIWDHVGVTAEAGPSTILTSRTMPGARWFPGARLNFAENLLREAIQGDPERIALTHRSEGGERREVSYGALHRRAGAFEHFLLEHGVVPGDRVAAVLPNGPEAVVGMLGTTSLGAIWTSVSPDFGADAILDRFAQIEPTVLLGVDGYRYGGKPYDRSETMRQVAQRLPSVRRVVMVETRGDQARPLDDRFVTWSELMESGSGRDPSFRPQDFDHPIYILYSSGTTGAPKCIVHGAGGVLLQHAKELRLHVDLGRDEVLFYHTTTAWMMWNWLVSGLLTGSRLVLYGGSPGWPDISRLWRLAQEEGVTHFGTSARHLALCRQRDLRLEEHSDPRALRVLLSTGSPLLPEDFDWVYGALGPGVLLSSISGGTDIVSCFVGGNPLLPVRRGRIQGPMLGMDVHAYDGYGRSVVGEVGELVCRKPVPSMPVGFWNDPDGIRYSRSYFESFPGVWAHGDLIEFHEDLSCVIHGRSDATLNPGGVRIGTAEISRIVESLDPIRESLVVGQPWEGDERVVLLVVLQEGCCLDEEMSRTIKEEVRRRASPRHVPAVVAQVDDVPRTRTGKRVEVAVTRLLRGDPVENRAAIANPETLDAIKALPELRE